MDELILLESSIKRLESLADSLDFWLTFWTAVVVVGLVVEYAQESWELVRVRPFDWQLFRKIVGGILITVGVAGELFVGIKLSGIETALREANGKVIALLNRETEKEKLARVQIEGGLAGRRLDKETQKTLVSKLRQFSGQRVELWFNVGDHEANVFAVDIATVLRSATWDVLAPASRVQMAPANSRDFTVVKTGMVVKSAGDEASRNAAAMLVQELRALGFDVSEPDRGEMSRVSSIWVEVEARPTGLQGKTKVQMQERTPYVTPRDSAPALALPAEAR